MGLILSACAIEYGERPSHWTSSLQKINSGFLMLNLVHEWLELYRIEVQVSILGPGPSSTKRDLKTFDL